MGMDPSFFKSEEFRSLLGRYEQMQKYSVNSYFSTDDLLEIASYYLYKNNYAEAENVITYARKLYPSDSQITEAEVRTLGGRGISRFNSYSRLAETTLESTILAFSCNDDGMSAVVTDEDGYRTALIVLDKKLNEIYKWQTSEHFAFMPAISPDGDTAAVLCIGQKSAEADLYIRLQETGSDRCRGEIRLGNKRVYSMEFSGNDTLSVLADDGYYIFDMNGELRGYAEFASGSLITFEHEAEGLCAVSLKGARGSQSRVVVFGRDGGILFEGTYDSEVRSLALRGGTAAFAAGSHVFRADIATGEISGAELSGIRDVIITGTGSVLAVYPDCARIVAFDVTQGEEA